MNPLAIINTENGGRYYAFFYFLAFLVGFAVLLREGRKRKYPILPWLLIVMTCFLFFIIGTQAIRLTADDWFKALQLRPPGHSVGRSVLGGIVFVIPALLLAKKILRFHYSTLDAFAWVAPIGLATQRLGCLLAGCCYGSPATIPWGIQYGPTSHAYLEHLSHNLIPTGSISSLSIHPVAVYEITGCFIIILSLGYLKKVIKAPGNLFLSSIALYTAVRFVTEFFRSGSTNHFGPTHLTLVQVILIHGFLILLIMITRFEMKAERNLIPIRQPVSNRSILFYFMTLMILFLFSSIWLNAIELLAVGMVMIPTLALITRKVFYAVTVPSLRRFSLIALASSFILMSQTLPETNSSDSTKHSYNIFSIGALSGNNNFELNDVTYDCSGGVESSEKVYDLASSFRARGAGYTRVEEKGFGKVLQYGIDAYWGTTKETVDNVQTNEAVTTSIPVLGIHPYFQYDWAIVGVGAGLHVGTIGTLKNPRYDYYTPSLNESISRISAYPSAYFRVGYVHKFFGEIKLGQQFPTPFPSNTFQTNFGLGFGKHNGTALRIGTSSYSGVFIAPTIPLGKTLLFEPYIGGAPSLIVSFINQDHEEVKQTSNFVAAASLRYKFGEKFKRAK